MVRPRYMLPIDSWKAIYSYCEFIGSRPEPAGRTGRAPEGGQREPRRRSDRPVATGDQSCLAAPAGGDGRSSAGPRWGADGTDAEGRGPARATGGGAGAGPEPVRRRG